MSDGRGLTGRRPARKLSLDLLKRLDAILSEVNAHIDDLPPNGKQATTLFEPVQELGWAVDELLGRHKPLRRPAGRAALAERGGSE